MTSSPQTINSTPVTEAAREPICEACSHSVESHDAIARRFCTATAAGGLDRGCVCSGRAFTPAE